jgi:hypothetical protein
MPHVDKLTFGAETIEHGMDVAPGEEQTGEYKLSTFDITLQLGDTGARSGAESVVDSVDTTNADAETLQTGAENSAEEPEEVEEDGGGLAAHLADLLEASADEAEPAEEVSEDEPAAAELEEADEQEVDDQEVEDWEPAAEEPAAEEEEEEQQEQQQEEEEEEVAETGGQCEDLVGWISSSGFGCDKYSEENWCANGAEADGWDADFGTMQDWADAGGISSLVACCDCGGGVSLDAELRLAAAKQSTTRFNERPHAIKRKALMSPAMGFAVICGLICSVFAAVTIKAKRMQRELHINAPEMSYDSSTADGTPGACSTETFHVASL